jgi:hypothetical protein
MVFSFVVDGGQDVMTNREKYTDHLSWYIQYLALNN